MLLLTTNQYLINNISRVQLAAAYATNNPTTIATKERYYLDLKEIEDRVEFTDFLKNNINSKWYVNMTCWGRGYRLAPPNSQITVSTGNLLDTIKSNCKYLTTDAEVESVKNPGAYIAKNNNFIFLCVKEGTSVKDALELTGCNFTEREYRYNDKTNYVDVDCPVVAGRMKVVYIVDNSNTSTEKSGNDSNDGLNVEVQTQSLQTEETATKTKTTKK